MLLTALGEASTQLIIPSLGALEEMFEAAPGSGVHALSAFVAAFGLGQLVLGPRWVHGLRADGRGDMQWLAARRAERWQRLASDASPGAVRSGRLHCFSPSKCKVRRSAGRHPCRLIGT